MTILNIDLPCLEWQAKFSEDPDPERVMIGGVGSGKSIAGADELIELGISAPLARWYVIGASHPTMKEGTIPTLCSRIEEHGFEYSLNRSDLSVTLTSGPGKGCRFIAWTVANERFRKLKSQLIDGAWLDECQIWDRGDEAYDFIFNRLRPSEPAQKYYPWLFPRLWVSANPPHTTSHWLYKRFVEKKNGSLYRPTVYQNFLLPKAQREAYIERLKGIYSEQLFKIEVLGEFGDIGVGRVYGSYVKERNVSDTFLGMPMEYDPSLPLMWAHDFGVTPRVSLIMQRRAVDEPGYQREVLLVLDEITINDGSTDLQIAEFTRRYPVERVSSLKLYGDPAGQTRNSTTAESDWAMLETDYRLKPYRARIERDRQSPLVVDRVNAVNAKFFNANEEIGILIHPRCVDTIEDAQKTRWKDGTRVLDHGSKTKGLMRTHWTDTLGYPVERIWPVVVRRPFAMATANSDTPVMPQEKKRGLVLGSVKV